MLIIKRTNCTNRDFMKLVVLLDIYLKTVDGEDNAFYHQYNGIEDLNYVVVAYYNNSAVGCGAIKKYNKDKMEIKRMFVLKNMRGKGIATMILKNLELWAVELSFSIIILETGKKQVEAIQLYKNNNYLAIPNFDPYVGVENSFCFQKVLQK